METDVLERVEHLRDRRGPVRLHEVVDQLGGVLLLHRAVDELILARVEVVAHGDLDRALDLVVVDDPADRREQVTAIGLARAVLSDVMQADDAVLV